MLQMRVKSLKENKGHQTYKNITNNKLAESSHPKKETIHDRKQIRERYGSFANKQH